MVPNNYTLGMSISSSWWVVTTPLRKTWYKKKRLRKTRVKKGEAGLFFDHSVIMGIATILSYVTPRFGAIIWPYMCKLLLLHKLPRDDNDNGNL